MTSTPSRRTALSAALAIPASVIAIDPGVAEAASGSIAQYQRQLNAHGFWCGDVDGVAGPLFSQAVTAVQKVYGLPRTGRLDARTSSALAHPSGPRPNSSAPGIEVHKDTQTLWSVGRGSLVILDVATADTSEVFTFRGRRVRASTPSGTFRVYSAVNGWQNGVLGEMYRPRYFNGDIAIHGVPNGELPPYPASHGCCRISVGAQDMLIASHRLAIGTSVRVF